jgi:hypothetical protein
VTTRGAANRGIGTCGTSLWWRVRRGSWAGASLLALFGMAPLAAQPATLTVRVRSQVDGAPLVNAEVIAMPDGLRALTRETGVAVLRRVRRDPLTVRVRQLGHAFADVSIDATTWPAPTDTLEVRLAPVALRLPTVTTRSALACPQRPAGSGALAFDALDQLREGAERYETFRRTYRFRVEIERRTSRFYPGDRRPKSDRRVERSDGERWGARYRPAEIIERGRFNEFSAPILFVTALGDARFWEHHCLTRVARERDTALGPVVRLAFEPTRDVGWTDWRGVVTLDSASWVLRRIDFALDVRQRDGPRRLEGFTTFDEVSPLVSVPDRTGAAWWYGAPRDGAPWGEPQIVQVLRRLSLVFRDTLPPRSRALVQVRGGCASPSTSANSGASASVHDAGAEGASQTSVSVQTSGAAAAGRQRSTRRASRSPIQYPTP